MSTQIKQLIDDILQFDEIIKVEWDGKLLRCFRDTNKQITSPILREVAVKMEVLKTICNIQRVSPFAIIDSKE